MKCLLIIALSLSLAFACQKMCNGHGECATGDKCECYPGYGGADCSERSCPYSEAFVDLLPGDLDHDGAVTTATAVKNEWYPVAGTHEDIGAVITTAKRAHRYAECSNAGICDRNSGLCKCNSGFEGSACQRRSCPASADGLVCSGHGMCLSSEASIIKNSATPAAAKLPSGWEYQKFGVCECDKGWTGISCGSRICPKGLDPVNVGKTEYIFSVGSTSGSGAAFDASNSGNTNDHYYVMEYDGVTYTTPIIPARKDVCGSASAKSEAAEDIRRAIVSIPPLSQAKVSIKCDSTNKQITSIEITTPYIELDLPSNFQCVENSSPCTVTYSKDSKITSFAAYKDDKSSDDIKLTLKVSGAITEKDKFISCSGRGTCDETSGLCQCFDNYSGLACEKTKN